MVGNNKRNCSSFLLMKINIHFPKAAFQKLILRKKIFTYVDINPTGTPRRIHADSTSILHQYVEDQILTNFHVISTYFFDVISLIEKSTLFPRTFFDVISIVEKSMLFPRTFFDVILTVEKSTLFPHTFFDVISLVEKSTLFPRTFFNVISMVEISTLFLVNFFDGQKFDIVFGKL